MEINYISSFFHFQRVHGLVLMSMIIGFFIRQTATSTTNSKKKKSFSNFFSFVSIYLKEDWTHLDSFRVSSVITRKIFTLIIQHCYLVLF